MLNLGDWLKDPLVQKALLIALAGAGGFVLRWLLPPFRKVVDGDVSRLEKEYQEALRNEEAAKKTADPNDDVAAHNVAVAAKKTLIAKQRLRDALGGIPDGE